MKPTLSACAALPLLLACGAEPTAPGARTAQAASAAPPGLEQVVSVDVAAGEGRGRFGITSTLVNRGDAAVTVHVRSCHLQTEDLRGETAGLRVLAPLMLCARVREDVTLAPGESTEPLTLAGETRRGATHHLLVRHLLRPEHWEPVTVRIP